MIALVLLFALVINSQPLWCGKPYEIWPKTENELLLGQSSKSDGWRLKQGQSKDFKIEPLIQPYTNEKIGKLWTSIPLQEENFEISIECFTEDNQSMGIVSSTQNNWIVYDKKKILELSFDLGLVPMGMIHKIHCQKKLSSTNGLSKVLYSTTKVHRFEHKSNVVKINTLNRFLVIDDLPFFPIGFYLEFKRWQVGGANFTIAMFKEVANGYNTPLPYRPGSPQELIDFGYLEFMDDMEKMGMKVHFDMYATGMQAPSPAKTETIRSFVNLLKDKPSLLGYYIADEPDGQGVSPEWIADTYNIIKELDPYHPITIVLNCVENPIYQITDYFDFGDIVMSDPYPIGLRNAVGCDGCEGNIMDVSRRAEQYVELIEGRRPFWMVPQAFGGEQHWDRQPNDRELRLMTYLSVIGGATGIQHFILGALIDEYNQDLRREPYDKMWSESRLLAIELNDLLPALSSIDSPPNFDVLTSGLKAKILNEQQRGVITIIVANPDNFPKSLQLKVTLSNEYSLIAEVLYQQREVPISSEGIIEDFIDAMNTRIYRIYTKEFKERNLKTLKENMILNPSFEIQSHTGFPNSFMLTYNVGGSVISDSRLSIDGYHSIRLTNPGIVPTGQKKTQNNIPLVSSITSFTGSRIVGNTTYIASVFAKAAKEGLSLEMSSCFGSVNHALSMEWKEYLLSGASVESLICSLKLALYQEGTIWVDSVSLIPKE